VGQRTQAGRNMQCLHGTHIKSKDLAGRDKRACPQWEIGGFEKGSRMVKAALRKIRFPRKKEVLRQIRDFLELKR